MVFTLIEHWNDVKMSENLQWNHWPAARGATFIRAHFDVISMVDNKKDNGIWLLIWERRNVVIFCNVFKNFLKCL